MIFIWIRYLLNFLNKTYNYYEKSVLNNFRNEKLKSLFKLLKNF